ncbi:MAG TPA: HEXXH motif-containing putative peptide modification protein [Polyangium sp.]|nr:HEXXH motif-containing putative peptide modification protein [Polyangium sp.]
MMLSFMNLETIQAEQKLFVRHVLGPEAAEEPGVVPYFTALNQVQRYKVLFDERGQGPRREFDLAIPEVRDFLLRTDFKEVGVEQTYDSARQEVTRKKLDEGFEIVRGVAPQLPEVINRLTGMFVFAHLDDWAAGSGRYAAGIIWLNMLKEAPALEYAEYLVHETTHQALYLYEMIHTLFSRPLQELGRPEALVVSSIRKVPRSLLHAFHAACVSVNLVQFYDALGMPDKADTFFDPLLLTLSQLREKSSSYMTRGGIAVLEEMEALMNRRQTIRTNMTLAA